MFVDIAGYVGVYKISPHGEIFSSYRNRFLKGWVEKTGYRAVSLMQNGKPRRCTVHTLLAKAFIPNPNQLPEVNHKDGDKQNNALSNLEWVTGAQNIQHAFATGLTSKVACIDYSKLPALVAEIISGVTLREICNRENIKEPSALRKLLLREAKRTGVESQFIVGTLTARQSIVSERSHSVIKKDSNGNTVEVFSSINAAARSLNKSPASIWKAIKREKIYMAHYWEKDIA